MSLVASGVTTAPLVPLDVVGRSTPIRTGYQLEESVGPIDTMMVRELSAVLVRIRHQGRTLTPAFMARTRCDD